MKFLTPLLMVRVTLMARSHTCYCALVCLLYFSLFSPVILSADQGETTVNDAGLLTLNTALQLTLAKNPSLSVFLLREQGLAAQSKAATLRPAYELGLTLENVAGTGKFSGMDSAEYTLSLSSVIELGGQRRARGEVVSSYRTRLQAQQQVQALDVLADVTRRYIDVLAAQQRVHLAQQSLSLANDGVSIVKRKALAGAAPNADVKRSQAGAAQAKLVLASEQQRLNYLKVALASSWGQRRLTFSGVEGNLYQLPSSVDFETLYARLEGNPAIDIFSEESRVKEAEIRLAKVESNTNVHWSVGVRQLQESNDTALTAGVSMPLFSSKRQSGVIALARAEQAAIDLNKEVTLLALHTQLYRLFSNRQQAALTTRTLQADIIPALQQALDETQAAYQNGGYRYLDYVATRQELLSAQRALIDSASSALKYDAEIEQLTAEPITHD